MRSRGRVPAWLDHFGAAAVLYESGDVWYTLTTAIVTLRPGGPRRHYRLPTETDCATVHREQARIAGTLDGWDARRETGAVPGAG